MRLIVMGQQAFGKDVLEKIIQKGMVNKTAGRPAASGSSAKNTFKTVGAITIG